MHVYIGKLLGIALPTQAFGLAQDNPLLWDVCREEKALGRLQEASSPQGV